MSKRSVIVAIRNLSQSVAALIGNPAAFNNVYATTLINTVLLIRNDVQALPLTQAQKNEIIVLLNQVLNILNSAVAAGAITIQQLNSILALLQLAVLKVETFCLCD